MSNKAAFITGGASGMGLAIAEALSVRGGWDLHLVDLNAVAGKKAMSSLKHAYFHQTNVTNYASLSSAFETAFQTSGRLDFVFANAGIVERDNFYEKHDLSKPPPEPNQLSIDINLKAVVNTSYLALHYFRKSPKDGSNPALVMTASCGGLYPSEFCPMYSGSKAAVIHFNRSIAFSYRLDGIRTYATCPGTVRTNLMTGEEWKSFPEQYFTPVSTVVGSLLKLIDGGSLQDGKGKTVQEEKAWGLTVEINGENMYFTDHVPYCDENMEAMMKYTSMENQLARIEKGKNNGQ
ncbi:NAD(P)-binding protein [Lindgomyces ingoldianus]|uniref:NAD(P)-binding protein n=1 Tax=Lindgomyces ingoldianus TaxID=673940 RepID=A0ACB6QGL0_9PLEO|nr:NAD(P)-binding protein [Lindgomyces ingoldianus]KAF2465276.1 NAD(P)-binding protein [Lindgomyces ingoldianus]